MNIQKEQRIWIFVLVVSLVLAGIAIFGWTRTSSNDLSSQANTILSSLPPATQSQRHSTEPPHPSHPESDVYGVVRIPAMKLSFPLVEGVDKYKDLPKGIGHYSDTAQAGELGNFAVAGHVCCVSNGQPFKYLDWLESGDKVYVDTAEAEYTYSVISATACGPSQIIVPKARVEVIYPVPCTQDSPTKHLMTLTTCEITQRRVPAVLRRIVWAELESVSTR